MGNLRCAIGFFAVTILLQVTLSPANATNSSSTTTTTTSTTTTTTTPPPNTNSTTEAPLTDDSNSTETESSKKDKRQAQRGYTDIPIDEGPYDDIANSSPPTLPGFESDLPSFANFNDLNNGPSNYLPEKLDRDPQSSFFSQKVGIPSGAKYDDNIPAAAVNNQETDNCGDACDGKPIPGEAGRDYPIFSNIPKTGFSCKSQQWPGYYADTEARCQVFWICQKNRMDAFLCPNGTLFNQQVFVCDWWFNVDCNASPEFYSRNQFLYAGRGIGIDGKPTRGFSRSGGASSSNVFVSSVLPRPSGVNSNPLVNQVQSTNQIARVATVTGSQNQPSRPPTSSNFYDARSSNNQPQTYVSSQSQQNSNYNTNNQNQNYNTNNQNQNSNSNSNQNQQQQKYTSNQSLLVNRMQKNPTGRPQQATNSNGNNQYTGGYDSNQLSLNSQSDFDRRSYSASGSQSQQVSQIASSGSGRGASFKENEFVQVSSTRRPESNPSPSSPRPSPSSLPKINVNIDTKSNKQTLGSISSTTVRNLNTIGSTARPTTIRVNTDVPLFGPGSSTIKTPKDIVNQFTQSSVKLIGSSQTIYNSTAIGTPSSKPTTRPPSSTTLKSITSKSSNQGFLPVVKSAQGGPSIKSDYGPPGVNPGRPTGPPGNSFVSPSYGPSGNNAPPPHTTTQASTQYGAPGHTPGTPQAFVDRGGFGKESRNKQVFVSSTPKPNTYNSLERRDFSVGHGQRSNQFSNVNGQREIMYSPSKANGYVEYPYSPSQQKNKQKLLELQSSKGITTQAKDIFAYPHYHGQRSNAFSDGDSVSFISNNNKQVTINHSGYAQRKNPFTNNQQTQNVHTQNVKPVPHQVQASNQVHKQQPLKISNHNNQPINTHNQQTVSKHNQQQFHHEVLPQNHHQTPVQSHHQIPPQTHQNGQPQIHHQPPLQPQQTVQQVHQQSPPQIHHQAQSQNHQQVLSQNHQQVPQNHQQVPPQHQQPIPNQHQVQPQHSHHSPQHIQAPLVSSNQVQQFPQLQQQQNFNQQKNLQIQQSFQQFSQSQGPSPSPSPNSPFHERLVKVPSQNLELPAASQLSGQQLPPGPGSRDGYTSLQSGSFISIATSPSPFSKQILKHSVFQSDGKQHKPANNAAFVTTSAPFAYSSTPNSINGFRSSTGAPQQYHHAVSLSTTLRPPPIHSTALPFTNSAHPTPYTNQNGFVAAPTQAPFQTTSPGHRQNPYLPHNHGKRTKSSSHQGQKQGSFPNSLLQTTIKYPEGTGSLRLGIPNSGTGKRNIIDFTYAANPTSSSAYPSSTTTPFPSNSERFNQAVSSTTPRPLSHSSPSPQPYKDSLRIGSGARLAGAVINKSTSSSSAIYVDSSDTAESQSVSTPVSVSPSQPPPAPVATSNFGLRISSTAKKRMAGAWQNYFSGNEKENAN